MLNSTVVLTFIAESADAGQRLDHFLQTRLKQYSRARLQSWIKGGRVLVNGCAARIPESMRIVDPELPASRSMAGAFSPSSPPP